MSDLIRLMELAGMTDAVRSNEKLNELGLPKTLGGHGLLSKNAGDNFVILDQSGDNFLRVEITSRFTRNTYILKAEPYGMSASRGSSLDKIYVRFEIQKPLRNTKNENFKELSSLASDLLSQWVNSNQPKELDAQPADSFVQPVMQKLSAICVSYNAQKKGA